MKLDFNNERAVLFNTIRSVGLNNGLRLEIESEINGALHIAEKEPHIAAQKLMNVARRLPPDIRSPIMLVVAKLEAFVDEESSIKVISQKKDNAIDLAIICATEDEYKYIASLLILNIKDNYLKERLHGVPYKAIIGSLPTQEPLPRTIVLACQNKMGMVEAAATTGDIIQRCSPRKIVMIGVCGGNPKLKIKNELANGDVIIVTETFTYATGKIGQSGFERLPGWEAIDCASISHLRHAVDNIGQKIIKRWTGGKARIPECKFGPMACGDYLLDLPGVFEDLILPLNRETLAVDMESYAVLRTTKLMATGKCEAYIMKAVMDFTLDKTDHAKPFAAFCAAQCLVQLVEDGAI